METGLYELTFKDGRIFRVFTANRKQYERLSKTFNEMKIPAQIKVISNGIHTIKQFENIMNKRDDKQ